MQPPQPRKPSWSTVQPPSQSIADVVLQKIFDIEQRLHNSISGQERKDGERTETITALQGRITALEPLRKATAKKFENQDVVIKRLSDELECLQDTNNQNLHAQDKIGDEIGLSSKDDQHEDGDNTNRTPCQDNANSHRRIRDTVLPPSFQTWQKRLHAIQKAQISHLRQSCSDNEADIRRLRKTLTVHLQPMLRTLSQHSISISSEGVENESMNFVPDVLNAMLELIDVDISRLSTLEVDNRNQQRHLEILLKKRSTTNVHVGNGPSTQIQSAHPLPSTLSTFKTSLADTKMALQAQCTEVIEKLEYSKNERNQALQRNLKKQQIQQNMMLGALTKHAERISTLERTSPSFTSASTKPPSPEITPPRQSQSQPFASQPPHQRPAPTVANMCPRQELNVPRSLQQQRPNTNTSRMLPPHLEQLSNIPQVFLQQRLHTRPRQLAQLAQHHPHLLAPNTDTSASIGSLGMPPTTPSPVPQTYDQIW